MFTKIAAILAIISTLGGAPAPQHSIYMRGMEITALDPTSDLVTCEDSVGYEWQFYGCSDYAEGDIVCCLMDTMGTENTIEDDAIISTNYSGYWVE
jgi:hypothetical protein